MKKMVDVWLANGTNANPDQNSGDPIGISVNPQTAYKGIRSTSADALVDAPSNLHIAVETEIARVIFDGNIAIGITTMQGQTFHASKEIVLSCGTLDTPRVLMFSGIGDPAQLNQFGIPVVKANTNVGQHLKDHNHMVLAYERADHVNERHKFYKDKSLQAAARQQWEKDGTGPLAEYACAMGMAYLKLDTLYDTREFQELDTEQQAHLRQPTIPHYEVLVNAAHIPHFLEPDKGSAGESIFVFALNQQSTGWVKLQSADPSVPLLFNPNFFSHPFDRRLAIEATRAALKVIRSPEFSKDTIASLQEPASDSDEDILEYWKQNCSSTWHMLGTARMGKHESEAVVDRDFKVFGVKNLRVADMSVVPIMVK
jgi:choline dehydrogenase-like flavoprotein